MNEKVLNLKTKTFHQDFLDGNDLPETAKQLRSIIVSKLLQNCIFTFENVDTFHEQILKELQPIGKEYGFRYSVRNLCEQFRPPRPIEAHKNLKGSTTETMEFLATVLCDGDNNRDRKLDKKNDKLKSCHVALVNEKVTDLRTKRFHNNFLNDIDCRKKQKN